MVGAAAEEMDCDAAGGGHAATEWGPLLAIFPSDWGPGHRPAETGTQRRPADRVSLGLDLGFTADRARLHFAVGGPWPRPRCAVW